MGLFSGLKNSIAAVQLRSEVCERHLKGDYHLAKVSQLYRRRGRRRESIFNHSEQPGREQSSRWADFVCSSSRLNVVSSPDATWNVQLAADVVALRARLGEKEEKDARMGVENCYVKRIESRCNWQLRAQLATGSKSQPFTDHLHLEPIKQTLWRLLVHQVD